MLDVKDKMDSNLPVGFWWLMLFPQVLEGLVLMELGHLKGSRVLPLGIAIVLVKHDSMAIIQWDFVTFCLAQCHVVRLEPDLIDHAEEFIILPCNAFEVLPTIQVKQVVLPGTDCTGDRIVCDND